MATLTFDRTGGIQSINRSTFGLGGAQNPSTYRRRLRHPLCMRTGIRLDHGVLDAARRRAPECRTTTDPDEGAALLDILGPVGHAVPGADTRT